MVLRGRRVWLRALDVGGMWGASRSQGVRVRLEGRVAELRWAKGPGNCFPLPPSSLLPLLLDPLLGETLAAFLPKREIV